MATFCDKQLASVEFSCVLVHKKHHSLFFLLFCFFFFFSPYNTEIKYVTAKLVKCEIVSLYCRRWFKWQQDQENYCEDFLSGAQKHTISLNHKDNSYKCMQCLPDKLLILISSVWSGPALALAIPVAITTGGKTGMDLMPYGNYH